MDFCNELCDTARTQAGRQAGSSTDRCLCFAACSLLLLACQRCARLGKHSDRQGPPKDAGARIYTRARANALAHTLAHTLDLHQHAPERSRVGRVCVCVCAYVKDTPRPARYTTTQGIIMRASGSSFIPGRILSRVSVPERLTIGRRQGLAVAWFPPIFDCVGVLYEGF